MTNPFSGNDLLDSQRLRAPITETPRNPFAGNVFRDAVSNNPQDAARLRLVQDRASGLSPEDAMEAFRLGVKTDVPRDVVLRNLDTVKEREAAFDPEAFVREANAVARWVSTNEANAALAKDDLENLGTLERLLGSWRNPEAGVPFSQRMTDPLGPQRYERVRAGMLGKEYARGLTIIERGQLGNVRDYALTDAQRQRLQFLTAELSQELPAVGFMDELARSSPTERPLSESAFAVGAKAFEGMARGTAQIIPMLIGGTARALETGLAAATGTGLIAAAAGPAAPMTVPAAAGVGLTVGSRVGAYQFSMETIRGNLYRDLLDEGIGEQDAWVAASGAGFVGGLLELVSYGVVLKNVKDAARALQKGVVDALKVPTNAAAIAQGVRTAVATPAAEFTTEGLQQGAELLAEEYARSVSGMSAIPAERYREEMLAAAIQGGVSSMLLPLPGAAISTFVGIRQAAEAEATKAKLVALSDAAEASKVRERLPEAFREVADAIVAEHGPVQHAFVPVDRLVALLQEYSVPENEFIETALGGNADALEQAKATGGDVVIPFARYIELSPSPLGRALADDTRLELGAPTAREARDAAKPAEADIAAVKKDMEELVVADLTDASERRVVDALLEQALATGMSEGDARINAEAAAKFWIVQARRYQREAPGHRYADAWTLWSERGVQAVGVRRAEALLDAQRAMQRARQAGKSEDEIAAIGARLDRLVNQRQTIRSALEAADVRDEAGRLAKDLKPVDTDALAVEVVRMRQAMTDAQGQLAALTETTMYAEAMESPTQEEAAARLEDVPMVAGVTRGEMENVATAARLERELRKVIRQFERSLPRLERELASRGVESAEAYLAGSELFADAEVEGVPFQTATIRAGRETLERYGLDPSETYTNREVAAALERRQREKYGTIGREDRSPDAMRRMAEWMTAEVEFEMQNPEGSGIGWYSEKFQAALDALGQEFPEMVEGGTLPNGDTLTRQGARDLVTAIVAITSDGADVQDNLKLAVGVYRNFRETGTFELQRGHQREASFKGNLADITKMYRDYGADGMREVLLKTKPIKELKVIAKARGMKFESEYQVTMQMPMSVVTFGEKLGAFYANLMGQANYLTMDRWWSRTFNRYRGTLLTVPTEAGLARFKELLEADAKALAKSTKTAVPVIDEEQIVSAVIKYQQDYEERGFKSELVQLVGRPQPSGKAAANKWMADAKDKAGAKFESLYKLHELERAANTLHKAMFESLEDAPFSAKDRTFMIDTVAQARTLLGKKGFDVSPADLQAILWYYEKKLYGQLTRKKGKGTKGISYADAARVALDATRSDRPVDAGVSAGVADGRDIADGVVGEAAIFGDEASAVTAGDAAFGSASNILEQAAWHGSPYVFPRFSLSAIGTGEGAQAYGWGLYFAESIDVAEGYRQALAGPSDAFSVNINGKAFTAAERGATDTTDPERVALYALANGLRQFGADTDKVVSRALRTASQLAGPSQFEPRGTEAYAQMEAVEAEARAMIEAWRDGGAWYNPLPSGALYRVDIPDAAVARFLDWDKPLSEQAPEVRKAFGELTIEKETQPSDSKWVIKWRGQAITGFSTRKEAAESIAESTGGQIYNTIALSIGQRGTSESLLAAGIPGIKYLDAGSRGAGEGSRNLVVFDENLVTITQRNGEPVSAQERADFLEQGRQRGPQAFYLPRERVIGLLRTADRSSFMHEMSHHYLRVLRDLAREPDAPASIRTDYDAALTYIGVTPEERDAFERYAERGFGDVTEQTKQFVGYEEKWARSFEAYLQRGIAPSRGLQRAFRRYKVWLTSIYSGARAAVLPEVNPDLINLFDRLLATDEEMAELQSQPEHRPFFEPGDTGITDAEYEAYVSTLELVDAQTDAELTRAILAETERERTDAWQTAEAEVRAEVEAEIDAEPIEVARRVMQQGILPDGTKDTPNALNRQAIVNTYGAAAPKSLPSWATKKDGGLDADAAALIAGFPDGDTLIAALQVYVPRDRRVAAEVSRRMREQFPDLLNDSPALAEAAQTAAHRAQNDDGIVWELKKLGKVLGIEPPSLAAVKAAARQIVDETTVRDLSPYRHLLAERKAARLAEQAKAAGNLGKAEFHKRQQLLNRVLYRESQQAVERVDVIARFGRRMSEPASRARLGKVGQSYLEAMDAITQGYEFARVPLRELARRERISAFAAEMDKQGIPIPIPDSVLKDAEVVNYRTVPYGKLTDVYDTARMINHLAGLKGRLLREAKKRELAAIDDEIVETIARERGGEARGYEARGAREWFRDKAAAVHAAHLKPEFLFRWLDGDVENGPVWQTLFRPLADAESAANVRLKELLPLLDAVLTDNLSKAERQALYQRVAVPGHPEIAITKASIMALARNMGNETSRQAVYEQEKNDGTPLFTPAQINAMLGTLTAAEWRSVQAAWDTADTLWADVKALEERVVGVAPEKVEAVPFTVQTADGQTIQLAGGYYPLSYDTRMSTTQYFQEAAGTVQDYGPTSFSRAATQHGHTESRVGSGGKPIRLDLSVLNEHVINVIHDLTHREAILDVGRLLERPRIAAAIQNASSPEMYRTLRPWLARIASDRKPPIPHALESILGHARVGTTVVNMGIKATTALVQPTGFLNSVELIGAKYARRGLTAFLSDPKGQWEWVKSQSPAMAGRQQSFDRDVRDIAKRKGTLSDKDKVFFWATGFLDMAVAVPTWLGAYAKAIETQGLNHEDAVAAGDSAVRLSQGAGGAKDLAAIQGGPEVQRLFSTFYTFWSALYGLFHRSFSNVRTGRYSIPRFGASMLSLWFVQAILSEIIAGRGPEEDEDWGEWAAWELARYPFNGVILARDMANAMGPDGFDFQLSPTAGAFAATTKALKAVGSIPFEMLDDEAELTQGELKSIVEAAGYWGHLPTRQMWITGTYLYDWMMGYEAPESAQEAARNLLFTRPR